MDKKFKEMVELSRDMDHMHQDEQIFDAKDEYVPQDKQTFKNLTLNKKSWFNQDIFKEISDSLDEH